jgi:hypothetical protein
MGTTVATHLVANYLRERFGRVWVHPKGTRAFGKLDLPAHRVAVAGWYPDVLCRMDDDRIVSVVMELGSKEPDLMRGLGKAVALKEGVHAVLLAADAERIAGVRETVLRAGVGVFSVGEGEFDVEFPPGRAADASRYPQHADVLRELEVLEMRKVRRRFPTLSFDHPLHFVAPVLAIRPGTPQPKQEVASLLLERWGYAGPRTESWWNSLYGGLFLGLVQEVAETEDLRLTDIGYHVRTALLARYSAAELRAMTQQERALIELSPNIAFLCRALYLSEPDAGLIIRMINGFRNNRIPFTELVAKAVQQYPNQVLNVYLRSEVHKDYAEAWRCGTLSELLSPNRLRELVHPNLPGIFKQQLIHLGVLKSETKVHTDIEKYRPEEDLWLRPD